MTALLRWLAGRQQLGVKPGDLADHIGPLLPAWWLMPGGTGRPPEAWGYLPERPISGLYRFAADLEAYRAEARIAALFRVAAARMADVARSREDETP